MAGSSETVTENFQNDLILSEIEKEFMEKAFFYAKEALSLKEVPVGCIFVFNGEIVAVGRNTVNETHNATRHAEMNCIDQVNDYCKLNSLDLHSVFSEICVYVTVEPCIMCSAALYDLKVKSVIFGCRNDRFGGQSVFDVSKVLHPATIVKGGYRADEAMNLLKEFYKGTNPSAPVSKNKNKKMKKDYAQSDAATSTTLQRHEIQVTFEDKILQLQINLNEKLRALDLIKPPIAYVYNPLEYAFKPNEVYIKKYCSTPKKILFVGMNPGLNGMCQTGVPFGDVKWVRDWLKVKGEVGKPQLECLETKVLGFSWQRKEESGDRFWSLFCELCGSPENFFKNAFVINFCPLGFLNSEGNNVTPTHPNINKQVL